jgi:hypothetical protein
VPSPQLVGGKMNKALTLCILLLCSPVYAEFIPDTEEKVNKMATAIYHAEGGGNAHYPYGIRSIPCSGNEHCRRICKNSIRNGLRRWNKSGRKVDFITHFGSRYAPTRGKITERERAVNPFWVKNVRWFLKNPKKI